MKDSKKIKYNLIIGILGQIVVIVLGILVPKLVLTNYGSEVNGLLSSVTNIYSYVAVVEAGIAAAACQALYKAISRKDFDGVNSVLSATNKYYHRTGIIYLFLVFAFSLIYPALINSDIPYHTIALIIFFNGIGNVINYFFHGKYLILLKADGKNFVRSGLDVFMNAFKQISKIIFIQLGYSVLVVQFAAMLVNVLQMIYITYYMRKKYPWIDLSAKPDFAAISQSKNVFVHEINYLITSNVDIVLLTVFSTLKVVSVYSMYSLLINMVNKALRIIKDALEFKIAHAFHTDRHYFLKLFKTFEVYYISFAFSLFTITNYFILPFLSIYTDSVTDVNYIDKYLPYLFVIISLLAVGRYPFDAMVHISGCFKATQKSAIIEAVINITTSILLINIYGIYGVLLGTIISSLYRTNYLIVFVSKNILKISSGHTYKCWGVNFVMYVLVMFISRFINVELDTYVKIFAFCILYSICVMVLFLEVTSIVETDARRFVFSIFKKRLKVKK